VRFSKAACRYSNTSEKSEHFTRVSHHCLSSNKLMQSIMRISLEVHNEENKFSTEMKEPVFIRSTKQVVSHPSQGLSILWLPVLLDRKRYITLPGSHGVLNT
jgi:hypothetical protein